MNDTYKFCILAAGEGTRNNSFKGLHKALLPVNNRPVISIIIDKVPKTVPVVVALGYKGEQVKTYLQNVYPNRIFEFIDVENYSGPGSGPGLSLLKCEKAMQCPFIFTSADTIVDNDFQFLTVDKNWVGVSQVSNTESHEYCLVKINGELVEEYFYGNNQNAYAFTGIAGVLDYKDFWKGLRQKNVIKREHQVLDGLRFLTNTHKFNMSWLDTGNVRAYTRTKSYYPNNLAVEKDNEAIFVDNGYVIKYFEDPSRAQRRVERASQLSGIAPPVIKINENMYSYSYVEGNCLSNVYDEKILYNFLNDYHQKFRHEAYTKNKMFLDNCKKMYQDKTRERVKVFHGTELDNIKVINGVAVKPIAELLDELDWASIYEKAIPSKFHGDLQPENLLVLPDGSYLYIDWRESFGEGLTVGDAYYDLGKLYHALVISNNLILNGAYEVNKTVDQAEIKYTLKNNLYQFLEILKDFCAMQKYEYEHVQLLGVLNYLNIASLYGKFEDGKYGEFLFLLGKKLLVQYLEGCNGNKRVG